jgi:hypothetical protein
MKKLLSLAMIPLITFNCIKKQEPKVIKETEQKKAVQFEYLSDYPTIKDSLKFITNLRQAFDLKIEESGVQRKGEKITIFKKVKINGSNQDFYFIEYDWKDGSMASYPWKYQVLLTTDGKLIKTLYAQRFEFLPVFPKESPFLLATIVTAKGNGGHDLYKITGDSLENVYEGNFRTYDAHEDNKVYEPNELNLKIKDFNKDGFNDISFNGKIVLIQAQTPQGDWYDSETIDGKQVNYFIDHPFKKIPVEFIFLYDKKTGHFKAKEDYVKKYDLDN